MRKTDAFRRAAALMAALSITVSLAAPAFAGTYYIDNGDITITKKDDGSQEIKQNGTIIENDDRGEIVITTSNADKTTLESDLEGPAAEDSGFGPVVEDNYQPAQPEDAEEPKAADQPESTEEPEGAAQPENAEEPKSADRQESADQQPQQAAPAAAAAAPAPGFCGNIITVINNFANKALKLTLKDVKIDVSGTGSNIYPNFEDGKAALSVQGQGDVEIELDGDNELKSGFNRAGLEKNTSTSTGKLTLKDDNKDGSLRAEGGSGGAGIGGGSGDGSGDGDGENITIKGGRVTAVGNKFGAGIGGSNGGSGKHITITGGEVTATGGDYGAGIGGGYYGSGEHITINGGTVNATGGWDGAGIGGGDGGSGENITITGGTVNAVSGQYGAGIGGGSGGGSGEDITITGGTVNAVSDGHGAGIGGGAEGSGQNIKITGGTVNASGWAGAGIGGGVNCSGSHVTVSGAAQVTVTASKGSDWDSADTGATIGNGGSVTEDGDLVNGEEIQADISGLTTGYIHHIIYEQDGTTIKKEWWEFARPQPNPEDPNAPAEESNEVDLGTPLLHVETLEGDPLPFDARQQGSTLRVTTDNLAARLHGTRQALEALREQGVEQIQFVTSLKTTTLPVAELLAEGGSWFALEHDGLVSRQLSAAQAESLKCWMH